MKSVITKFEVIADEVTLEQTRYVVEIKGQAMPLVKVTKVQDLVHGGYTIRVEVPKVDGRAILADSTMDALARRVDPNAKVYGGNKRGMVKVRVYA